MRKIGVYNWEILPLRVFTCDRKTIREFERKWVEVLNTDLNTRSPLDENYNVNHNEAARRCRRNNIRNKTYHCDICNKSFKDSFNLKRHLNSLKHSYAYMNSVD